jgi:hypothetical protein
MHALLERPLIVPLASDVDPDDVDDDDDDEEDDDEDEDESIEARS